VSFHVIAGTAGHIDHGKTALVKALTGIDTDRLEEEKRRGISIDLGFAHLSLGGDFAGLRLGLVDVPGHERFIRNMLAGASGIDLVLLVVAADEGIKPQTREHFDICRLLGIRGGVIAMTKSDLVEVDVQELVRMEIDEFVAGSFLADAAIVPVSSVSGSGLDALRAALERAARAVVAKDTSRPPRLPIDRSFSMRGHGTVVTGTLISGSIAVGDELELYPTGRRMRMRGLQVHGAPVARAHAGERTAVNLAGIDASSVHRGMTLAPPGLRATTQIDCSVELLARAKPLKDRAPVHFHAGTAAVEARVRLLGQYARFLLSEPVLLLPGDRFILRMFSPVTTIGGGVVIDVEAPAVVRRHAPPAARLDRLEHAGPSERVALLVSESRHGMSVAELTARTGLPDIATAPDLLRVENWIVTRAWAASKLAHLRERLEEFHHENPLQPGCSKEDLRSREFPGAPAELMDALLAQSAEIVSEGETVRLAGHRVTPDLDETSALERIFAEAGLAVPAVAEALSKSGMSAPRGRAVFQMLVRNRKLVRVSEDLVLHASAIESLRTLLAARRGSRFTVTEFKNWTGVSRKYAIPLLEYLDREHVTRREGDQRRIV
jgi:selenocysteine-specific elongation factor